MNVSLRAASVRLALSAIAIVLNASSSHAQPVAPTYDDLLYATAATDTGAEKSLHLDLWLPQAASVASPLVMWIHGGGWSGGTYNATPGGLQQLLQRGFAVASVEYRLSGEAIAPAQIHDVKGAVRFLRANAELYHLDSERFAAWGTSAGGHLSALLATTGGVGPAEGTVGGNLDQSSAIQAAVDFFGPANLMVMELDDRDPPGSIIDHDAPNSPESRLVGFDGPGEGIGVLRANLGNLAPPFPEKTRLVNLMSPTLHVTSDDAPIFIAHGDLDMSVPILQSQRLATQLGSAGVEHVLRIVAGQGHGFSGPPAQQVSTEAIDFLVAQLAPVPEPASATLTLAGLIVSAVVRRPRRTALRFTDATIGRDG